MAEGLGDVAEGLGDGSGLAGTLDGRTLGLAGRADGAQAGPAWTGLRLATGGAVGTELGDCAAGTGLADGAAGTGLADGAHAGPAGLRRGPGDPATLAVPDDGAAAAVLADRLVAAGCCRAAGPEWVAAAQPAKAIVAAAPASQPAVIRGLSLKPMSPPATGG